MKSFIVAFIKVLPLYLIAVILAVGTVAISNRLSLLDRDIRMVDTGVGDIPNHLDAVGDEIRDTRSFFQHMEPLRVKIDTNSPR